MKLILVQISTASTRCVRLEESEGSDTDSTEETNDLARRDMSSTADNNSSLSGLRLNLTSRLGLDLTGGLLLGRLGRLSGLHSGSESCSGRASSGRNIVALGVVGVVADTVSECSSAGSLVGIRSGAALVASVFALGKAVICGDRRSRLGLGASGSGRGDNVGGGWVDGR